jgi:hypothetical protein
MERDGAETELWRFAISTRKAAAANTHSAQTRGQFRRRRCGLCSRGAWHHEGHVVSGSGSGDGWQVDRSVGAARTPAHPGASVTTFRSFQDSETAWPSLPSQHRACDGTLTEPRTR